MKKFLNGRDQGQALVIFALVLLGLLAMAALVLDGGMIYSHRRTAQAAADAGVLAGAYTLCTSDDPVAAQGAAEAKALEYVQRNNADSNTLFDIVADPTSRTVSVTAHITYDTFFAHLIGRPTLTAEGYAQSGCACVGAGEGVLPIAWACRWPVNGNTQSGACLEQTLSFAEASDRWDQSRTGVAAEGDIWHNNNWVYKELYIVMDTDEVVCPRNQPNCRDDFLCIEEGGLINCDLDGDGDRDLYSGGSRSWLDLNGGGGGGAADWIENGFPGELNIHEWLPAETGASANLFSSVLTREGDIVTVPVFNQSCDRYPTEPECAPYYHSIAGGDSVDDTIVDSGGTSTDYYHIVGFASFLVTCVDGPGNNLGPSTANPTYPDCPGRDYLVDTLFPTFRGQINSVKTIEGYFINGPIPGEGISCSDAVDTGSFVLRIQQ